jgi:hypothetical protein
MYCAIRKEVDGVAKRGPEGARCDEVFFDGGRGSGCGDGPDGVGGRLRRPSVVIDVNIGISHLGDECAQLSAGFLGDRTADRLQRVVD